MGKQNPYRKAEIAAGVYDETEKLYGCRVGGALAVWLQRLSHDTGVPMTDCMRQLMALGKELNESGKWTPVKPDPAARETALNKARAEIDALRAELEAVKKGKK